MPSEEERAVNVKRLADYLDEQSIEHEQVGSRTVFALPNGRESRIVSIDEYDADVAVSGEVASLRFVEYHEAIVFTQNSTLEVALTRQDGSTRSGINIWDIVAYVEGSDPLVSDLPKDRSKFSKQELIADLMGVPLGWQLVVEKANVRIEISPKSDVFHALLASEFGELTSAKITTSGTAMSSPEKIISGVLTDFLLELNLIYGLNIWIQKPPSGSREVALPRKARPFAFPVNSYSTNAKSLYAHGNAALDFPLLRYLSYYQVIEHFFQQFNRESVIGALSRLIRDPTFDSEDQADILRLIETTADAHRGRSQELSQLIGAVKAMISPEELEQFILTFEEVEHFTERRQKIAGLKALDPKSSRLQEEVSERVYALRNRIVHTKESLEGAKDEVILPSSREVLAMNPEIELVKWLAQRAIIHGAKRR
ncbi:hypothetical protein [Rathayibacter sp. AY2B9]|uniref:hypothetical protein n=1 Tax=Rathayibacter sp. AY2B9 TaxID=2080572 RepID=UPI0011B04852|nr:hypothetical protein [Rathayibacter sp. AY2B9]